MLYHRVFISYAAEDQGAGDEICAVLEAEGVPCWISHRDANPMSPFPPQIVEAIKNAEATVLVFSDYANASDYVSSEIQCAFEKKKSIVTIRIEDVEPQPALALYIARNPWIDSFGPSHKVEARRLAETIKETLSQPSDDGPVPIARIRRTKRINWGKWIPRMIVTFCVLAVAVLAAILIGHRWRPPRPHSDMVAIEGGVLHRGSWDSSMTISLLRKHGLNAGGALREMLATGEREVTLPSYLIDKYEVTNARYRQFLDHIRQTSDHSKCHPAEPAGKDHTPKYWDDPRFNGDGLPVIGVDWFDAYAYASWAGRRLPTADEWEYAARGAERYPYPWGRQYSSSRYYEGAVSSGLLPVEALVPPRPGAPVGLAGNVSEWTATPGEDPQVMVFRGGAWNHAPGEIYSLTFLRFLAGRDVRDDDLGFRCARDTAASPPTDMVPIPGGTVRLGGDDTPLCRLLRAHPDVADAVLKHKPESVSVQAFRMDRCEVTNAEYRVFLEDIRRTGDHSRCHSDEPATKDHTPQFWQDPPFNKDDQPVVGVDYYDAYAYAAWMGKCLPTADEWELAARGTGERLYPWGDTFEKDFCVCEEGSCDRPVSAKSHERDRSPFGVVHLAGNVMEWTDDDYGVAGRQAKLLKGGAWSMRSEALALTFWRGVGAPRLHRDNDVGFRCVIRAHADQK